MLPRTSSTFPSDWTRSCRSWADWQCKSFAYRGSQRPAWHCDSLEVSPAAEWRSWRTWFLFSATAGFQLPRAPIIYKIDCKIYYQCWWFKVSTERLNRNSSKLYETLKPQTPTARWSIKGNLPKNSTKLQTSRVDWMWQLNATLWSSLGKFYVPKRE